MRRAHPHPSPHLVEVWGEPLNFNSICLLPVVEKNDLLEKHFGTKYTRELVRAKDSGNVGTFLALVFLTINFISSL